MLAVQPLITISFDIVTEQCNIPSKDRFLYSPSRRLPGGLPLRRLCTEASDPSHPYPRDLPGFASSGSSWPAIAPKPPPGRDDSTEHVTELAPSEGAAELAADFGNGGKPGGAVPTRSGRGAPPMARMRNEELTRTCR